MVGPSKSRPPMSHRKTDLGIPCRSKSAKVVLSFVANRSSFLIGELLLGKLSKAVVVVGNAPHDRPGCLVGHLIGNRASFLCTKAPMLRTPETNFLQGITSINGRSSAAVRHQPRRRSSGTHSLKK